MDIIDYCSDQLAKYFLQKDVDGDLDSENNADESLENELSTNDIDFEDIIDDIYNKINERYNNDTAEKRGCFYECAELIGKSICHSLKLLSKEGLYYNFNSDEIEYFFSCLDKMNKLYRINKSDMENMQKTKMEKDNKNIDRLRQYVPIHWTYDSAVK